MTASYTTRRTRGLIGPSAVVLVMVGIFATGVGLGQIYDLLPALGRAGSASDVSALGPSRPVSVAIPAIEVRTAVHPVGLDANGAIAAPALERSHETGWYDRGPTPGQYGPAIIVGHVDGREGPAIFHRLHTLRPGDVVEVTREDRQRAVFRVDSVERFDKTNLPVGKVYGEFSRPVLRLITCGGPWVGGDTGYADNVVVFASLIRTGG